MHEVVFVTLARPGPTAAKAELLGASLLRFGGRFSDAPLWLHAACGARGS